MSTTPPQLPALTLRGVRTVAVEVPLRYVLGTSAATVRAAPLLLVDVETEQGIVGRTYIFCYRRSGARSIAQVLEEAAGLVRGEAIAPPAMAATLQRRYALLGVTGIVRMALSALDAALWDAVAVAAGVPLATLLGSAPRPVRAYNSCGLGLMSAAGGRRRGRAAARGRLRGRQAAPRLRDARRGPGGHARRAPDGCPTTSS